MREYRIYLTIKDNEGNVFEYPTWRTSAETVQDVTAQLHRHPAAGEFQQRNRVEPQSVRDQEIAAAREAGAKDPGALVDALHAVRAANAPVAMPRV